MMNKTTLSKWVFVALSTAAFSAVALSPVPAASCVQFSDGWASLPVADGVPSAGYGHISNTCEHAVTVTSVHSSAFAEVSLHETHQDNDVNRMRDTEGLTLEAGQSIELAPGGRHLMLSNPSSALEEGQTVPVEFTLVDGSTVSAELQVRGLDDGDDHDHHDH